MVPQPQVGDEAYAGFVAETATSLAGEALTAEALAEQLARSLDRLLGLFDALALLAVIIGAVGIVNTLTLGVTERPRDRGARAHGMTVSQVEGMVVTEAAIIGVVGGLLAVVAGVAITGILVALAPRDRRRPRHSLAAGRRGRLARAGRGIEWGSTCPTGRQPPRPGQPEALRIDRWADD